MSPLKGQTWSLRLGLREVIDSSTAATEAFSDSCEVATRFGSRSRYGFQVYSQKFKDSFRWVANRRIAPQEALTRPMRPMRLYDVPIRFLPGYPSGT